MSVSNTNINKTHQIVFSNLTCHCLITIEERDFISICRSLDGEYWFRLGCTSWKRGSLSRTLVKCAVASRVASRFLCIRGIIQGISSYVIRLVASLCQNAGRAQTDKQKNKELQKVFLNALYLNWFQGFQQVVWDVVTVPMGF